MAINRTVQSTDYRVGFPFSQLLIHTVAYVVYEPINYVQRPINTGPERVDCGARAYPSFKTGGNLPRAEIIV